MQAKKTVVVTPKNPFESLAISDSDSESEMTVEKTPVVAPPPIVAPVAPRTPPFRPWPEGMVPPPVALSGPSPFAKNQRKRGKTTYQVSEDGWVSIRASEPYRPTTPPLYSEPEILYASRESPVPLREEEAAEVEALAARVSALAPPQNFPSLLTRGVRQPVAVVLDGKIDASDEESARQWAEKISKNLKDAEANRGLSFFKRG